MMSKFTLLSLLTLVTASSHLSNEHTYWRTNELAEKVVSSVAYQWTKRLPVDEKNGGGYKIARDERKKR